MIPARSLPKSFPAPRLSTAHSSQEWQPFKDLRQRFANTRRMEQLHLHAPQKITATVADSALRVEMEALEPEQEGAPARFLWYKPMAWLGVLRPLSQAEWSG